VVWRRQDEKQRSFYRSILAAFPESIASIAFVVDSRDQSFCLAITAYSG